MDDITKNKIDNMFHDSARSLEECRSSLCQLMIRLFLGSKEMFFRFRDNFKYDISEHEERYEENIEITKYLAGKFPIFFSKDLLKEIREFEM